MNVCATLIIFLTIFLTNCSTPVKKNLTREEQLIALMKAKKLHPGIQA